MSSVCVAMATASMFPLSAAAQSPDSSAAEYSAVLQAIADTKLSIAQQEAFLERQKTQIESLNAQLAGLEESKAAILPMVEKMAAAIAEEVSADYPFEIERRTARINSLKETVANPETFIGEKFRRALEVLKIEVNYGQSLDAYEGNRPPGFNPTVREGDDRYKRDEDGNIEINETTGEKVEQFDGRYMRYGRTAFVYLNNDGTLPLRYDLEKREWVEVPKAKAVEIRRAIRVSTGEIAPRVVMVPVEPSE